jgi:hypothetical protein
MGSWRTNIFQVGDARFLNDGRLVYLTQDGSWTKMVASDGEARYYLGTIAQFNPSSWIGYIPVPTGNYKLNIINNICTGPATSGCVQHNELTIVEPYRNENLPVRYIRLKRNAVATGSKPAEFIFNIWAQMLNNTFSNSIQVRVSNSLAPATGGNAFNIDRVVLSLPNTSNAVMTIDLLEVRRILRIQVAPLDPLQWVGVEIQLLDSNLNLLGRNILFDRPIVSYLFRYRISPARFNILPTGLSGRYVSLRRVSNAPGTNQNYINIRQLAVYNPQGKRYVPVPPATGVLFPSKYVSFVREPSIVSEPAFGTFLSAPGPKQFSLNNNGGITALALVRFTGTAQNNEQIFSFSNPWGQQSILLQRVDNTRLQSIITINNDLTKNGWAIWNTGGTIVQNRWTLVGFRFSAANVGPATSLNSGVGTASTTSCLYELFQDGIVVSRRSNLTDSIPREFYNCNLTQLCIGSNSQANGNFLNGDVAGLFIYDRPLSDAEMGVCSSLLRGGAGSPPTNPIYDLRASNVNIADLERVSQWGEFVCQPTLPSTSSTIKTCDSTQRPYFNDIEPIPMSASMSDIFANNSTAHGPNLLIDGNFSGTKLVHTALAGTYSTATNVTNPSQFVSVDLTVERPIGKIVVFNRTNGGINGGSDWMAEYGATQRTIGCQVMVSNNTNNLSWNSSTIGYDASEYIYETTSAPSPSR